MAASPLLALRVHPGLYCISRLAPDEAIPAWTADARFLSITRTGTELSVVCDEEPVPPHAHADRGWRLLGVEGPLDLNLVGILAGLTATLAQANVSVFVVSTYDTDYLLVRNGDLRRAVDALESAGHAVR
jgi:hypothetical protein